MVLNDTLANAMISIKNAESVGHDHCVIRPASKLIKEVLKVMKTKGYIGEFEEVDDGRDKMFKVSLVGRINNCRAIKPRYACGKDEFEEFETQFLPARNTGLIVVTTVDGVMSMEDAKNKKIGGRLLAYVY